MSEKTFRKIVHVESDRVLLERARWCDTFRSRLRGFTFRQTLEPGEGLVLVGESDSRLNAAIHMLFVPFELGVIWVNTVGLVVDTVVARPWRLSYAPQAPACYVIEGEPAIVQGLQPGDRLHFAEIE